MRIAICQPCIPTYRRQLFEDLGSIPDVELTVYANGSQCGLPTSRNHDNFDVINVPENPVPFSGNRLIRRPDFVEAVASKKYDLVILPWNARYINLAAAVQMGRRTGVPVVLWGHGYSKHPRFYADWQRNRIGRAAAGVLLYTQTVADLLIKHHGYDAERVFVAQNAIDQEPITNARHYWTSKPDRLADFRMRHHVNPSNTMIFVSRLLKENGIDMMIKGLHQLRASRPEANAVIVGSGPEEFKLRSLVSELGLSDHVQFTGAIYDELALAPWMLSAGLFVYPKNIGLSIMHAFGYGLPTVTSDALSHHNPEVEALVDGVNGYLYRDGDLTDMVRQFDRILQDSTLRQRMGRAALNTVTEKYTLKNTLKGFMSAMELVDGATFTPASLKFRPIEDLVGASAQEPAYSKMLATGS